MTTIQIRANIALSGSNSPDFERVYARSVPEGFVWDAVAALRIAGEIADRYTDAGAVCVSDVDMVGVLPEGMPIVGSVISLDQPRAAA